MKVIEQMLQRYPQDSHEARAHALREVMQEIALAGLYRGGFFERAAFYGGTCLRIFYGLPRFSEDLDFSLLNPDPEFSLQPYFKAMQDEFAAFGFAVEISAKHKAGVSDIASAFLKKTASVYDLRIAGQKVIKIKFEVDTDPPAGFSSQEKLLLQPYSFFVKCFSLPDLFAGKMHALLFRQWQNRVKGRDWFDFEWYVRQGCSLNLQHFAERARQSGDLAAPVLSAEEFRALLEARIHTLDVNSARQDVVRFIKTPEQLDIWSQDYFLQLARMIRID
ncbi:nucleotidyl transferase AbiEii/AbiGii toxin family protein [Pseudomonas sp. N040]|uniref:nucleotidyl transferase AbiEii/AbiGii toxin family protein n=1 Tax=Pseudomonas sp. N040 TaxID=2785325 RepID=UPI001C612AC8|nr:nucleotidyl transferase AbiEii/AbiGii toxin family protein [Pseudomonas sp. N040]